MEIFSKVKRIAKTGFEQDAVTGWRKVLCYMSRPGVAKKAKRQINRRERREMMDELAREVDDAGLYDSD